jgi:phospho-N-acetylmuramoyl-pentapeptide-transferase
MAGERGESAAARARDDPGMTYAVLLLALAVGFLIVFFGGAALLPVLARLQVRQHAYEDAPRSHQGKTGTPTMGGILFAAALLPLVAADNVAFARELFMLVVLCGLVGFVDDMLAIKQGRNRGLRARTKFLATALAAIVFLRAISESYAFFPRDVLFHAGSFALAVPHWLWLLLGITAITGTIHAVNLTDGLDGLATGTMLPPLAVLAAIGFELAIPAPTGAALLGVGACIGFLVYNRHPAKVFMGDTGSLALGALLSGIAILEGEMLLLVLIGGVFVAEALSVILQVSYFKATGGKRIFRMSPLHHHFELVGWPETKVTRRFWFASLLCAVAGWVIVR